MSFLHPPHLAVIWPLIWGQLMLLRAAVRAAFGKGVQYHWKRDTERPGVSDIDRLDPIPESGARMAGASPPRQRPHRGGLR